MKHFIFFLSGLFMLNMTAIAQFNIPVNWTGGGGNGNTEICGPNVVTFTADPIPPGMTYQWVARSGNCPIGPEIILSTGSPVFFYGNSGQIYCRALDSLSQVQGYSWDIPVMNPDFNGGICDYFNTGSPITACSGDSVQLQCNEYLAWSAAVSTSNIGDTVLQWQLNGIDIPGAINNTGYWASASGTYRVKFKLSCGTSYSNDFVVTISPPINPTFSGPTTICNGMSTSICVSGPPFLCYIWNIGAITQCINISAPGVYSVTVCDANGCTGTGTVVLTVNPLPVPNITGNNSVCQGSTTVLDAGPGYSSYLWSTSETTQTINAGTAGPYTVWVTDANGCTGTDTFNVTVHPLPEATISGNTSICNGQSTNLNISITGTGPFTYTYGNGTQTFGPFTTANSPVSLQVSPSTTTTYTVVSVSDAYCNGTTSGTATVTVQPPYPTVITASGPVGICQGDSVQLSVQTPMTSYQWYKNNIVIPGATNSTLWVSSTGNYKCASIDSSGCDAISNQKRVSIVCFPPIDPEEKFLQSESAAIDAIIFPNPSTGECTIRFTNEIDEIITVNWYDAVGKLVRSDSRTINGDQLIFREIKPGSYLLEIRVGSLPSIQKSLLVY